MLLVKNSGALHVTFGGGVGVVLGLVTGVFGSELHRQEVRRKELGRDNGASGGLVKVLARNFTEVIPHLDEDGTTGLVVGFVVVSSFNLAGTHSGSGLVAMDGLAGRGAATGAGVSD